MISLSERGREREREKIMHVAIRMNEDYWQRNHRIASLKISSVSKKKSWSYAVGMLFSKAYFMCLVYLLSAILSCSLTRVELS